MNDEGGASVTPASAPGPAEDPAPGPEAVCAWALPGASGGTVGDEGPVFAATSVPGLPASRVVGVAPLAAPSGWTSVALVVAGAGSSLLPSGCVSPRARRVVPSLDWYGFSQRKPGPKGLERRAW